MICKNCNAEIPAEAKFCAVCGTKVEAPAANVCKGCGSELADGVKFCAVCGTPVAAAPAAPVEQPAAVPVMAAAPVAAQPVMAAAPAPVQPVSAVPMPANDVAAPTQPVSAVPTPANDVFAAPVAPPSAQPVQPAAFGVAAATAAPVAAQTAAPGEFAASAPVQSAQAPAFDMSAAAAAAVQPVKKGGKKIALWITLGVVALLAVAAVVVGFCFRGVAANVFMGNNKYAAMIEGDGIRTVTENTIATEFGAQAGEIMSGAVSSALASGTITSDETSAELSIEDLYSAMDLEAMLALYYQTFMDQYGVNAVDVTIGADLDLSEAGMSSLGVDGDAQEILDIINNTEFSFKVATAEDALAAEFGIKDNKGFVMNMRGIVCADGTVAVMLPFVSDKAVKMTFDANGEVVETETIDVAIDDAEIERLMNEIVEIYLKYYESAAVKIDNGSLKASGLKAEGRLITVEMDEKVLGDMIKEMFSHIAKDEYLSGKIVEISSHTDEELTKSDIEEALNDMAEEAADDIPFSVIVKTVVDNNGTILAKSYALSTDEAGDFEVVYVGTEKEQAFTVVADDEDILNASITQENETDGKIRVEVTGDEYGTTMGINVEYTGVKTEKYFNSEIAVGKYEIYLAGTEDSESDGSAVTIVIDTSIDGNTLKNKISAEASEFGTIGLTLETTPENNNDMTTVPSGALDITNNENWTDDEKKAASEYILELCQEIKAACSNNTDSALAQALAPTIDELIASLETALTPMASYDEISELSNDVYDLYNTASNKLYDNYSYVSDTYDLISDFADEVYDLYSEVGYAYEMTSEQLESYKASYEQLLEKSEEVFAEVDKEIEEAKAAEDNGGTSEGGIDFSGLPAADPETIPGRYDFSYADMYGERYDAEYLEMGDYFFILNADGTANLTYDGGNTTGTWTLAGAELTIVEAGNIESKFYVVDGALYADTGMDILMVFEK